MTQPLHVIARIRPHTEFLDQARQAIMSIIDRTLDEPGCHGFVLHQGNEDGCLYLYECFEDEAAYAFHHEQDYTKAVFKAYEDWLAEPPAIYRMRKVA